VLEDLMKTQRLLVALTVVNLLILSLSLNRTAPVSAEGAAPVLRGRALEIVDDRGRVRATISVLPADPEFKMPDGTTGYPETVLLRLISPEGRPNVKIGASKRGSGLLLAGEADPTYMQVLSEGASTTLKLSEKKGRERVISP
jgi:hypothetical protein